jgi:Family of unknown function (DUF5372)
VVSYRQNWGEDRVWFHDKNGRLQSVPANWTDVAEVDPFVVVAAGRSLFRITDLLEPAQRHCQLRRQRVVWVRFGWVSWSDFRPRSQLRLPYS